MPTPSEALATAIQHHQAGQLQAAEQVCRQILSVDPNHVEALRLLGVIAYQTGAYEVAEGHIQRLLELNPLSAQAAHDLGIVFHAQQRFDDAVASYRRALQLKPDYGEAYYNLGLVFHRQQLLDDAVACYLRALDLYSDTAQVLFQLGAVFCAQQKFQSAADCYRRLLVLKPDYAAAHNNLGNALQELGQLDEAAQSYRRALELKPDYPEACNNLGVTLQKKESPHEAVACYQRALEIIPDYAEAYNNLGLARQEQGEFDEAAASFRRALELQPDYAAAHSNQSMLKLLRGDFANGWPEYEWRWKTGALPTREFQQPAWHGEPLEGRRVLFYAEQGIGDTLQFIRYAPLVKSMGGIVLVECQKPLVKLLHNCSGIDQLIAAGDELPEFDLHIVLLSLPGALKTSLANIPAKVPYLYADSARVAQWRQKLHELKGFRIGINWHGREGNTEARRRDIPLNLFAALAQIPNVRLISLQKGAGRAELANAGDHVFDPGEDVDTINGAFVDTAAIIMNLDLVITSDTSIPHLAGALGVPVWLALPFVPNWRWLLDRADTPWYPTMRLFRQKSPGDWATVFQQIHSALKHLPL